MLPDSSSLPGLTGCELTELILLANCSILFRGVDSRQCVCCHMLSVSVQACRVSCVTASSFAMGLARSAVSQYHVLVMVMMAGVAGALYYGLAAAIMASGVTKVSSPIWSSAKASKLLHLIDAFTVSTKTSYSGKDNA